MITRSIHIPAVTQCMLAIIVLFATPALALRCAERPPVPGDTLETVEAACGPAALTDEWQKTVQEIDSEGTRTTATTTVELTYDSGPQEPMQSYRFEGGLLVSIGSAGYGRPYPDRGDACRNGELLAVGDTTVQTYLKCGEPITREKKADKVTRTEEEGTVRITTISVVEWTYRYGPTLPGYTVRFEEGNAVEIRPREFGK